MPVITLYDELGGVASEGGTWTYTGSTNPNPAPPATWDGTIDTTGFANGDYEYTYTVEDSNTVCIDTATITVSIQGGTAPQGDTCGDSVSFNVFQNGGDSDQITDQTFLGSCPGNAAPTLSAVALPASWTGTFSGDLWYSATISPSIPSPWTFTVIVTSAGLTDPLLNPYVAIYDDCTAPSLLVEDTPFNQNTVTTTIIDSESLDGQVFIRVGSQDGSEGNFTISATVSN